MFGDMAATTGSSMAMAFYPLQGQGLTTTTTTTTSSSYNPPHHMLSFTGSSPDPILMPPATTGDVLPPPPNPSPLPKYKFVTASPADWSAHEVATLNEGLLRYAHEPNIVKCIKIAAMLPAKTIRDVALRCCWTPGKESRRTKPDDYYAGKNMTYLKTEENMDLFLRTNKNIRAISERMRETHGIMGQMASLPVHVNDEHLSSLVHLQRGGKPDMKLT
ncbi:hypothetical protein BAE44_0019290 [Dichanthelium oligosanthes]|uniref:DUF3755 family protein n=1 Tax=Dichanthelium oligosanthes TaxID=888268 RepID=A0A1E5V3F7_9POAL|nr:hypothetical protein BAE44_0019290 [Dichanthelium oligosanthes]